jgi:hypothetical protein
MTSKDPGVERATDLAMAMMYPEQAAAAKNGLGVLGLVDDVSEEVYRELQARVTAVMHLAGEDPKDKLLVAIRVNQAAYGLKARTERALTEEVRGG